MYENSLTMTRQPAAPLPPKGVTQVTHKIISLKKMMRMMILEHYDFLRHLRHFDSVTLPSG